MEDLGVNWGWQRHVALGKTMSGLESASPDDPDIVLNDSRRRPLAKHPYCYYFISPQKYFSPPLSTLQR